MKRVIAIFICIIAASLIGHAQMRPDRLPPLIGPPEALARLSVTVVGGSPPAGGTTYPDIVFWLNFEANDTSDPYTMGSSECVLTGGDNTGTFVSAATISNTNCKVGSYCLAPQGGDDGIEFDTTNLPLTSGRVGFWIYNANAWAQWDVAVYYGNIASNENFWFLSTAGATDELKIQWRGVGENIFNIDSTTANIDVEEHYFIEVAWDTTLGATDYTDVYVNGVRVVNAVYAINTVGNGKISIQGSDAGMRIDNVIVSTDPTRDLYESGTGLSVATSKPSGSCP